MARNHFTAANSAAVALVAAIAKTALQLKSGTNLITALQMIEVTFDGVVNNAIPVKIDLLRQTTAGTMSALTPNKLKDTSTSLQVTAQENATVEPTAGALLHTWYIHPQAGVIHELTLPDGEIELPSAGFVGLRLTAPAAVNTLATIRGEE